MALRLRILCLFAFCLPQLAWSGEEPLSEDEKAVLEEATELVSKLTLRPSSNGDKIERIERPLLTYGDKARENSHGTLWAWGTSGRPKVFMELYRGSMGSWASAITLTSSEVVTMTTVDDRKWQPARPQLEMRPIESAPEPDDKESVRLRQMKELARRFAAHEFWDPDNSRFELRLLVQPVHRYKEESAKIKDGAAFLLAHGTNPEIVLLVEAMSRGSEAARWHFGAARLGSAELHLELDGKEVWHELRTPGVVGKPNDPYWLFITKRP